MSTKPQYYRLNYSIYSFLLLHRFNWLIWLLKWMNLTLRLSGCIIDMQVNYQPPVTSRKCDVIKCNVNINHQYFLPIRLALHLHLSQLYDICIIKRYCLYVTDTLFVPFYRSSHIKHFKVWTPKTKQNKTNKIRFLYEIYTLKTYSTIIV